MIIKDASPAAELCRILGCEEDAIDLAETALRIAEKEYPGLDVQHYLDRLDDLAACALAHVPARAGPAEMVDALNRELFEIQGFRGNSEDYYDPRNSYLNEVLDRRLGIPITLSIVYMAIGRRLGLVLEGVAFPGHFLVKLATADNVMVLDPFVGGLAVSEPELSLRLQEVLGANAPVFTTDLLATAGKKEILTRMLRNIKGIYLHKQEFERALYTANCLLLLTPNSSDELRDRGLIHERLECFRAALEDYQRYLELAPKAADSHEISARLPILQSATARLN